MFFRGAASRQADRPAALGAGSLGHKVDQFENVAPRVTGRVTAGVTRNVTGNVTRNVCFNVTRHVTGNAGGNTAGETARHEVVNAADPVEPGHMVGDNEVEREPEAVDVGERVEAGVEARRGVARGQEAGVASEDLGEGTPGHERLVRSRICSFAALP